MDRRPLSTLELASHGERVKLASVPVLVLMLALGLTLGTPLAGQSATTDPAIAPNFAPGAIVLNAGDGLRITVWRKPELSGTFQVSSDGTLGDPFYMDIRVAGVPFPAVVHQIRSHIEVYEIEPRVLVEPLLRVSVGGEVRQPNIYVFAPWTTIAQSIMEAGGPTERGRINSVRVLREGQVIVVDLTHPQSAGAQMPIRSGDLVFVGRRASIIRDYVAPISSITSATVSILYLISRYF